MGSKSMEKRNLLIPLVFIWSLNKIKQHVKKVVSFFSFWVVNS